ncbi:hypothetical protein [Caulobacter vibrioides]|uniref:hypothetical protein n=1 Tax=Caulobacter vibrioides TaxID=155892 RepID=UPI000BB52833|nr:hypothetical protein [Caulobacter vibrioides]ATC23646.1 hypothetical protein CA608_03415 [Caulobacter vibrioides]PLR11758.1 hypothetical protein CVUC_10155 [Caulobacter vibrioides]
MTALAMDVRELSIGEVDSVSGASELGQNVLKFAGVGGSIGRFGGLQGAAVGILLGAAVGVYVTFAD